MSAGEEFQKSGRLQKSTGKRNFFKICGCGKEFKSVSYYKHKKTCAAVQVTAVLSEENSGNFICQEKDCNFASKLSETFVKHLKSTHDIENTKEAKIFQNYSEFKVWKETFEKETRSLFVLKNSQETTFGRKEYYYCNRSGKFSSRSTGKRSMRSKGTRKIQCSCPAGIRVHVEAEKVSIVVNPLHYGHATELCHLPIPKRDKEEIASKLSQGIQYTHILRNIFDKHDMVLERKHLCTRQDILNISRTYGIDKIEKHQDDHISVDLYVEDLLKEESILLYKRQGDGYLSYPNDEDCSIEKNDFMLGIMTDFQKNMFKKFGSNIVCLDATHGTNSYGFNLITVLVIDEYREGIPVAWLLSNKETSSALTLFFKQIKKQVADISPNIFMSDKAPQYFNSWIEIFSGKIKKLLCHWHVQQDWKRQLNKIKNKQLSATVYKELCLLLEENDVEKFNCMLEECFEQLIENIETANFGKYFQVEWMPIKEEWGKCYRIGCDINSNMFVESYHKTLKYGEQCLKRKKGKRVDRCLSVLLQFLKDLAVKRLVKLEKENTTKKISEIHSRHKAALKLPSSLLCKISSDTWQVKSGKTVDAETSVNDDLTYQIHKLNESQCSCKIKCVDCNICLHSYSCNCPDGLSAMTICKHIHLLALHEKSSELDKTAEVSNFEINSLNTSQRADVPAEIGDDNSEKELLSSINTEISSIEDLKKEILDRHMLMVPLINNCTDRNALLSVKEQQSIAFNTLTLSANSEQAVTECAMYIIF